MHGMSNIYIGPLPQNFQTEKTIYTITIATFILTATKNKIPTSYPFCIDQKYNK